MPHLQSPSPATNPGARLRLAAVVMTAVLTGACGGDDPIGIDDDDPDNDLVCDLNQDLLVSDVPPEFIPAITEPQMVTVDEPGATYLEDSDRVIGILVDGQPRAYPHAVLDYHEVINDRVGSQWFTVTFCPLTGSGLMVNPNVGGQRLEIGVSGLLFANNLVVYDRTTGDVWGPQLSVTGKCSGFRDQSMELLPVLETSWARWKELHPGTVVVNSATGFNRNYRESPYTDYRANEDVPHDMPLDRSRPLKERVLAIRTGANGGKGYPFGELDTGLGAQGVINDVVGGEPTAVFYEGASGQTATAFRATVDGQVLTFDAQADGTWTDQETGSTWRLDGLATAGPLAGSRLEIREDAFVVYWFAWRFFQPDAEVWAAG